MTMMKQTLVAALFGCLLAMPSPARAAVTIGINFEGDTLGSAPGVNPTPGNPMTQPSAIGGYDPNYASPPTPASGTTVVGNPSGASKEVVMTTNSANGELGALWMDVNGFSLSGQKQSMSFDINVLAAPTNATAQPKTLGGGTAGIILGLNVNTTSNEVPSDWGFRFAAAPTSASGGVFAFRTPNNTTLIPFFNYTEGVQYNVSILADYSTGTLNASVNGNELLTGYAFWLGGRTNVSTNEMFFHLNGEPGFANSVALDNINAAAVPEPTTLVVWGFLAICGSVFAWHNSRKSPTA